MAHLTSEEQELRDRILKWVTGSGFKVNPHLRLANHTKETYRNVQVSAKQAQIQEHHRFLSRFTNKARKYGLDGRDLDPGKIDLELRRVESNSLESDLFLWWNLMWWSMPYQSSYGRRIRYMLWDRHHNVPFGIFLLQSPLLKLRARDEYLGLTGKNIDVWVNQSMSAQRVGALPPYNELIGGKMVALAMTADEVRQYYTEKYKNRSTLIENRILEPHILFITTTGAFGKSSMYDRLKYHGEKAAISVGQTAGNGSFHIPDCIVREIYIMLKKNGVDTTLGYGHGPSRKIRLLKRGLTHLGLIGFSKHGVRREIYLFPLVQNLHDIIQQGELPSWHSRPFNDIVQFWQERWCLPRSKRTNSWCRFKAESFFDKARQCLE